jgi:DnaJ-class molecular chaperone
MSDGQRRQVLNLPRVHTGSEITTNYRQLIAQHHPDKVRQLSPDLQEIARRKSREIVEAYEYFRVKYNLR